MLLLQSLGPRVGLWGHPHHLLDLHTLGFWQGQHPKQLACSTHWLWCWLFPVIGMPAGGHLPPHTSLTALLRARVLWWLRSLRGCPALLSF